MAHGSALTIALLALGSGLVWAQSAPAATPSRFEGYLPLSAQSQTQEEANMTLLEERMLGDSIAARVMQDPDVLDDAVLSHAVAGMWQKLIDAAVQSGEVSPQMRERLSWQLMLLQAPSINAFAMPGGYFGLHTGLIAAADREDEVAAVLAHEIAHVSQRHIARRLDAQSRQTPLLLAGMMAAILLAGKDVDLATATAMGTQAMGVQEQLNFSRDMEREADRIGLQVLTQAGFEPKAMASLFEKLARAGRLNAEAPSSYLSTHPLTTERIGDMQSRLMLQQGANNQNNSTISPSHAPDAVKDASFALVQARAKLLAKPHFEQERLWRERPSQRQFAQLSKTEQASALYMAAYLEAKAQQRQTSLRHLQKLQKLLQDVPQVQPFIQWLAVEVDVMTGHASSSLPWAQGVLAQQQAGVASSRPDVLLAAQVLQIAKQPQDVIILLQKYMSASRVGTVASANAGYLPTDAALWQQLAQALGETGQRLQALRATGEARLARMDAQAAVQSFEAAMQFAAQQGARLSNADKVELAVIDVRLRLAKQKAADWGQSVTR